MKPFLCCCFLQCAALVGEDQPLCPDLPELDLSELDVNDLDADSFLGGLKWYSDQSEIISNQYSNEPANIFEVRQGDPSGCWKVLACFFPNFFFSLVDDSYPLRGSKHGDVLPIRTGTLNPYVQNQTCNLEREVEKTLKGTK